MTTSLAEALQALELALDVPRRPRAGLGTWRWRVRQRLGDVREALLADGVSNSAQWRTPAAILRERNDLVIRLGRLSEETLRTQEIDRLRYELRRLGADVARHAERVRTLAD